MTTKKKHDDLKFKSTRQIMKLDNILFQLWETLISNKNKKSNLKLKHHITFTYNNHGFEGVGIGERFGKEGTILGTLGVEGMPSEEKSDLIRLGSLAMNDSTSDWVNCKRWRVGIVGLVVFGNVRIEGKYGSSSWVNCERWRHARLTLMLEMNIAMNKAKMKFLKDAIVNNSQVWIQKNKCVL